MGQVRARALIPRPGPAVVLCEIALSEGPMSQSAADMAETAAQPGLTSEARGEVAGGREFQHIVEALRDVVDPELGVNVVDLALVYGVGVDEEGVATIDMTLTSAACPLTDVIEDQTNAALDGFVTDVQINWVWLPPWDPAKITDDGREQLRAIGLNL